jgi:hypothetical protein
MLQVGATGVEIDRYILPIILKFPSLYSNSRTVPQHYGIYRRFISERTTVADYLQLPVTHLRVNVVRP